MATKKKRAKKPPYTTIQRRIIIDLSDKLKASHQSFTELTAAFRVMQGEWQIARAQHLAAAAQNAQLQHKLDLVDMIVNGKTVPAIMHLLHGPKLDIGVNIALSDGAGPCSSSAKHGGAAA